MRRKIIAILVAALAVAIPAALAATPVNGQDKANAARACTALRTSLGAARFGETYGTNASRSNAYGVCVSQWVRKANAARAAATTACKAKALTGQDLKACIASRTSAALATQVSATKNAAKACAAERTKLGAAAFAGKYGTNANKSNAFGKCVSKLASSQSNGGGGSGGAPAANHFTITLSPLNTSGAGGSGTLLLNSNKLQVNLTLSGLEPGTDHAVAIRGLSSGNASCPTASADTNNDGTISLSEGQPAFGDVLLALDQAAQSGSSQTISSSLLPLQSRTIVVLGKTVNGSYDATLPVACGTIATK
ncbi:MAG TPA: hypothetical protein VGJ77_21335 [Gaiellaceae bacterium]|jgi:hypothetical protein